MPNESTRKCTQCGNNGHNSRTCTRCKQFKLFGVQINVPDENGGESRIRKSKSMGNLEAETAIAEASGYTSDGVLHESSTSHERKKGKPWTEEEHRSFLAGLEKLGKGDWKGISKNFVPSRNSSQVASHAQKYFIRLAAQEKKHRRASVFDIPLNEENQPSQAGSTSASKKVENSQEGGNLTVPMKTIGELKTQASILAPVATSERPPLSPMTRRGVSDWHNMAYMQRASYARGSMQGLVPPLWMPVSDFSNQKNVFMPSYSPALTFRALAQPPVTKLQLGSSQVSSTNYKNFFGPEIPPNLAFAAFAGKSPAIELQQGFSQAGSASRAQNKDELNASIGNLAL